MASLPSPIRPILAGPAQQDVASSLQLQQIVTAVKRVAAAEIVPRFKTVKFERKPDGSLLTEADVAAQAALEEELQRIVPCAVLGEEMLEADQKRIWQEAKDGEWCWCIDPLDGTGNFVNGKPYFGVSVALVRNGVSQVGVIYDPSADEVFTAVRGQGASLNGNPLKSSSTATTLGEAYAEAGLYKKLGVLKQALFTAPPFRKLTMSGASVLQWCHLAAGRYDIFVHPGENPWDYAAGALILEETGGKLATFTHDEYWTDPAWQRSAIATSSPRLFEAWRDWVRSKLQ